MLPGPTNVPERVTRSMITPSINHRSDDFVELYEECVNNTKKIFDTEGEAVCLSASGTGAVECSVVNLIKKGDKVIIPVNGEFSTRLAQSIEWAGGETIRIKLIQELILHLIKSKKLLIITKTLKHSTVSGMKLLQEL